MSIMKIRAMAPNDKVALSRKREKNKNFTQLIIAEFRKHIKRGAVKTIADKCEISPNTINDWFCKRKGINGQHLSRLEREFPFILQFIDVMWRDGRLK